MTGSFLADFGNGEITWGRMLPPCISMAGISQGSMKCGDSNAAMRIDVSDFWRIGRCGLDTNAARPVGSVPHKALRLTAERFYEKYAEDGRAVLRRNQIVVNDVCEPTVWLCYLGPTLIAVDDEEPTRRGFLIRVDPRMSAYRILSLWERHHKARRA